MPTDSHEVKHEPKDSLQQPQEIAVVDSDAPLNGTQAGISGQKLRKEQPLKELESKSEAK